MNLHILNNNDKNRVSIKKGITLEFMLLKFNFKFNFNFNTNLKNNMMKRKTRETPKE